MKSSDMLPTPLSGKPKVKLTELARRDAGLGWETITYQGEDGNRYEVSVTKRGSKEIGYSPADGGRITSSLPARTSLKSSLPIRGKSETNVSQGYPPIPWRTFVPTLQGAILAVVP